jgi:hypothetical protein
MILTCFCCPLQLAFAGKNVRRYARAFGWRKRQGHFYCGWCA